MWETTYFERNSRQSSTFSINRALLVLSPCFFFFLSFEPNLLRPSHETHLLAFPTLCLAFQQINLTPLQPIRSTQSADIFDSLPRPFSLYFSKSLTIRLQVNRVVAGSNTPIMSIRLRSSRCLFPLSVKILQFGRLMSRVDGHLFTTLLRLYVLDNPLALIRIPIFFIEILKSVLFLCDFGADCSPQFSVR